MMVGIPKKIDPLGRVTIPKEYRILYRLQENETVSVVATQKGVLICNPKYKVAEIDENEKN